MPRTRCAVPPEHPSYQLRRLWLEEPTFSAYYSGFANEGLWPLCHLVDVRPQFRADGLGGVQGRSTSASPRPSTRRSRRRIRRSSSRTIISRWWRPALRRRRPHARGRRSSGTSRGRIPIASASAPGVARSSPGCSPTICSRSSSSAIGGTSCSRSRRSSTPKSTGVVARAVRRTRHHRRVGADWRGLRPHPGHGRRRRRSPTSSSGCAELFGLDGGCHRDRRRSARLHQRHPRAARGARRGADAAAGAARPADVRPDRRAVALGARQLRGHRSGDRPAHRRAQRASRRAGTDRRPSSTTRRR